MLISQGLGRLVCLPTNYSYRNPEVKNSRIFHAVYNTFIDWTGLLLQRSLVMITLLNTRTFLCSILFCQIEIIFLILTAISEKT